MIKYMVCKDVEIGSSEYKSEELGIFDDEEEAVQLAKKTYAGLSDWEREYYEILVWKFSGENLDLDDWDTIEEGETVVIYPSVATSDHEDEFKADYTTRSAFVEDTIHYCFLPTGEGLKLLRLWIGEETEMFVDRECSGMNTDPLFALEDWFNKYGRIAEEDWRECFPQCIRKMYLDRIVDSGYSNEEAVEILNYLSMTLNDSIDGGVSEMIELWKAKVERVVPYRIPSWKKKVLMGQEDIWAGDSEYTCFIH